MTSRLLPLFLASSLRGDTPLAAADAEAWSLTTEERLLGAGCGGSSLEGCG